MRNLPSELALIPFIESEFNSNNRSKKGAAGLWQLMKETAHLFGVKIKSGYDGRRNLIVSTKAALTYFEDLGNNFKGNWYLAIAAYNSGQFRVESAVRRAGSHNFWDLKKLPRETKEYVPKLLAVAEIVQNPEKYGVHLPQVNNEPRFTQ
jgi:membrane-bound lytic murein transglycosylase D